VWYARDFPHLGDGHFGLQEDTWRTRYKLACSWPAGDLEEVPAVGTVGGTTRSLVFDSEVLVTGSLDANLRLYYWREALAAAAAGTKVPEDLAARTPQEGEPLHGHLFVHKQENEVSAVALHNG
jgi:hypothetical protein